MPFFTLKADLWILKEGDLTEYVAEFRLFEMRRAVKAFLKACLAKIPVRTGFLRGSFSDLKQAFGISSGAGDLSTRFKSSRGKTSKERELIEEDRRVAALLTLIGSKYREEFHSGELRLEREREKGKKIPLSPEESLRKRREALDKEKRKAFVRHKKLLQAKLKRQGKRRSSIQYKEYYYPPVGKKILKTPTSGIPFVSKQEDLLKTEGEIIIFELVNRITYYRINDFYSRIAGAPWESLDAGAAAMLSSLEGSANRFIDISQIVTTFRIDCRQKALSTSEFPNNIKRRTVDIKPGLD